MSEGFAAIPNWMIRDSKVSRRAIVVYGALASRSGRGGIFPSQQQIAEDARCDERTVRRALNELEELGVVERVRRTSSKGYRQSDGYVLHPNGRSDSEDDDLRSDVSARDESYRTDESGPTGQNAQPVPLIEEEPLKKSAQTRGSRISGEWMPSPELLAWVVVNAPSVEALRETEIFRDFWIAAAGAKGVKQDWSATWRNWMRRTHDRNVERGWKPAEVTDVGLEEWMLR